MLKAIHLHVLSRMTAILSLAFLTAGSAQALTPPSSLLEECQTQGPVQLCRIMQDFGQGSVALKLTYTGFLVPSYSELNPYRKVSAWVQVDYRTGARGHFFEMEREGMSETLYLSNGCLGMGAYCKVYPSSEMNELFQFATNGAFHLNALDVEIAVVDENERWDSRYGRNYVFHFGERALSR